MLLAAFLLLFIQDPVLLEVGKPTIGIIGLESGEAHTPSLNANYTKAPTAGISYLLTVSEVGAYSIKLRSYDFDAYLILSNQSGVVLIETDGGFVGTHALVVLDLEADTRYIVQACALHGDRGKFQMEVNFGTPEVLSKERQWQAEIEDREARFVHLVNKFGAESVEVAKVHNYLGVHYFRKGQYSAVQKEWRRALEIREKVLGPEHPETATSLNNLAALLGRQSKYEEAQPLLERSLAIREKALGPEHFETIKCLNSLAALLHAQGNFEEAQPLYERSLATRVKDFGPEHPRIAQSLNNLAGLLYSQGKYEEARSLLERSLAIREKALGPQHPEMAGGVNDLVALLRRQGKYEEARSTLERFLAIREKVLGLDHPDTAMALNDLAGLLYSQGKYEEARPLYERSLAILEKVNGLDHPDTANVLSNLAELLRMQGNYEEARPLLDRSLATREKLLGLDHPDTAMVLNNLAVLLHAQGRHGEAQPLSERSLAIREKVFGHEHPETANSLNNLAALLQMQGKYEEAFLLRYRALSGVLQHLDSQLPTMNESGRFRLIESLAKPERFLNCASKLQHLKSKKPYSIFQQWKGKATRLQAASVRLSQSSDIPGIRKRKGQIQVLAKKLSGLVLLPLANQAKDHAQKITSLREERLRLERELNRDLGLDQLLLTPSLEEVQKGIPEGSVSVDFFVGKEVYAWILKPTGEPHLISLGNGEILHKAQNEFLRATATRGGLPLTSTNPNSAANLLDLLWGPLRGSVGEANHVFISPDGFLCELPFGILQEADGSYLLEKQHFVYLSDSTKFALTEVTHPDVEGSIFATGGINYFKRDDAPDAGLDRVSTRSRVRDSWNSLPATRDEIQALRDLHDFILEWKIPITVVGGKAATEERIRAELPGKRYVHIATHGYFEPDHLPSLLLDAEEKQADAQLGEQIQAVGLLPGLLSGLVFAGVNGESDPTRDDGYLSAEEIQHLDLSACDLVVLSACETALGSARAGEGLMSLRRSFSVAGADTVISSLWKVDDVATAQLMKDFYTNLWEKSMSRGDALHEAKLRMLRRNRIDNGGDAMPSTWGAFVLSGDWE